MRKIVLGEVRKHIREYGRVWRGWYFNNFVGKLPYGFERAHMDELTLAQGDMANTPIMQEGTSQKLRGMTYVQFYQDIDATIAELGLDVDKIESLQKNLTAAAHDQDDGMYEVTANRLFGYAFPLYIKMREKGYAHYPDLTS